MGRVILAGFLSGVGIFIAGAVCHVVLGFSERVTRELPKSKAQKDVVFDQKLDHGVYRYPSRPADATEEEFNARYREGNGMLIVGRMGEDPMTASELGKEAASNVVLALLCAWIVSQLHPRVNYFGRALVVVVIGLIAWLSISASHNIWYRFHWDWARDELFVVALEMIVAGLAIGAIVRPKPETAK
jgi:hypothetical protein